MDTPIKESTVVQIDTRTYEDTDIQPSETYDHFLANKPWLFQKGVSGNPAGRPMGKSMKEWFKEYLAGLNDEQRLEFFQGIPKETLWRMAEGNPTEDRNIKVSVPTPILGGLTQHHQESLDIGHDTAVHEVITGIATNTTSQDTATLDTPPMPQERVP